jgi:hypothetical protein
MRIKYYLFEGTFSSFSVSENSLNLIEEYQNGRNNLSEKIVNPTARENIHVSMIFSPDKEVDPSYEKYAEKRDSSNKIRLEKETFALNFRHYGSALALTFKSRRLENEFRRIFNIKGDVINLKYVNPRDLHDRSIFGLSPNDYKYASFKSHISLSYSASKNLHLKRAGLMPPNFDIVLDSESLEEYKEKVMYATEDGEVANVTANVATVEKPLQTQKRKKPNDIKTFVAVDNETWKNHKYKLIEESNYLLQNIQSPIVLLNDDTGETTYIKYGKLV